MSTSCRYVRARRCRKDAPGFTLIELIVAITITTIVVGFVGLFMTAPVDAYIDQSGRALLNDSAQVIARSLGKDLRAALPNSVRIRNVGSRAIVEMLLVDAVSFYRPTGTFGVPDRELDINPAPPDTRFSLFGRLDVNAASNPYSLNGYLVVANAGTAGLNAYQLTDVITPVGTNISVNRNAAQEESLTIAPGFSFMAPDSRNRLFLVSGPVTYICNSAAGARTLRRYSNYPVTAGIPTSEASAQLTGGSVVNTLLAANVASCRMRCRGGAPNVNVCLDTLVVEITADRPTTAGNESVWLLEHFSVDNST